MSELVRILQVSNECKCCLASRGSDVTPARFRSLPQISEQVLMAFCGVARLLYPARSMLNDTKSQCAADGIYCESNGQLSCGSQGLQVCEYIAVSRSNLIWNQIRSRLCVFDTYRQSHVLAGPTLSSSVSVNHRIVSFFISAMQGGHQHNLPNVCYFFINIRCC